MGMGVRSAMGWEWEGFGNCWMGENVGMGFKLQMGMGIVWEWE